MHCSVEYHLVLHTSDGPNSAHFVTFVFSFILFSLTGTFFIVSDVTDCDSIVDTYRNPPNTASSNTGLILGAVFGVLGVLVLIILVLWLVKRRNAKMKMGRLTKEELDEMLAEIIKRSKKDELYCKKGMLDS